MKRIHKNRIEWLLAALLLVVVPLLLSFNVSAAQLLDRSVRTLDPKPNAVTSHTFAFNVQSANSVGSISFEYCTNSPLPSQPCTPPAGLNVNSAVISSQTGETGFSVHANTTANRMVLSRVASVVTPGQVQYVLSNVNNPSTNNQTVYVRIALYPTNDGTGAFADEGSVVFKVVSTLTTRAYVPPFLTFCAAVTVSIDCSSSDGAYINLGELLDSQPNLGTSQFAGATNDFNGYTVSVFGTTITSGNQALPALTTPGPSTSGISQFGINLRDNSNPDAGIDRIGPGTAVAAPDYNVLNNFKYQAGDTLTSVSTSSNYNRFTVTYLVNVAPSQTPGIYSSTYTFIAVAAF